MILFLSSLKFCYEFCEYHHNLTPHAIFFIFTLTFLKFLNLCASTNNRCDESIELVAQFNKPIFRNYTRAYIRLARLN